MWFSRLIGTWSLAALLAATQAQEVRQIAIIGAGAAGASTAFHLRRFADEDGVAVNITLFEKTDHIGGRTLTVNAHGDSGQPVELGASIFVKVNEIIWSAIDEFGLPRIPAASFEGDDDDSDQGALGVWDGDRFVYIDDNSSSNWWSLARLFWTYGLAPYRANKLMQATVGRFLELYRAPYFPFRSLTTRAHELELTYVSSQTGASFLAQNNIGPKFAHDLVQASTRVNYASNLARIHGLDTMVSLAPSGASQVRGGNWRVFDTMVRESGAIFRANTTVASISLAPGTAPPNSKFVVETTKSESEHSEHSDETEEPKEFDNVIIAAPLQFSGIKADDGVLQTVIDEIPYVRLHVTLFTTALRLSPAYFKLPPGSNVPTSVLTTLADDDDDDGSSGADGAGKAGFFSVSVLRRLVNPSTLREEYIYKIFSPEAVTATFLSELFGVDVPETFTTERLQDNGESVSPISWYYPHVFYSYPKAYPRVTFQDPIVGDGVYYTSGIESFISTMETSALMGKNVARLIVDDIQGLRTGEEVKKGEAQDTPVNEADEHQKMVGEL